MAKVLRQALGGAVTYEDDDTPWDIRSFNEFGKSAILWLDQSLALHRAALWVMQQEGNSAKLRMSAPIALMLGGYAIETLLKMVLVGDHCDRNGLTLDSKKAEDFIPKTHDLLTLAKRAKLRINKVDRKVLGAISKFPIWAGRYPIPLLATRYDGPAIFDHIKAGKLMQEHPVWTAYKTLYPKLYRLAVRRTFAGQLISSRTKR